MKEDHMKNGQLKPGYNLQISTHDQFILHYSLHQNQADTLTLCPHMEGYKNQYDSMPDVVVADVEVETGLLAIAHNLAKMVN